MWVRKPDKLNKNIIVSKTEINKILDIYVNNSGEYLFLLDNGKYYICSIFPSVDLRSNDVSDITGTYQYLFQSQSKEAIHFSSLTGYYAIPIKVTQSKILWYFCKSESFEGVLNDINLIDSDIAKGQLVFDVGDNLLEKTDQFFLNNTADISFFKTPPTNALNKTIYYVANNGGVSSKEAPIAKVFTDSIAFDNSMSENLYSEFTGSYGSRWVGWLWFRVDNVDLYQKNADIIEGAGEWKLSYQGRDYYGTEPIRDAELTYSTKDEPLVSISVDYTTDKINRFDESVSIPNSIEVSSV